MEGKQMKVWISETWIEMRKISAALHVVAKATTPLRRRNVHRNKPPSRAPSQGVPRFLQIRNLALPLDPLVQLEVPAHLILRDRVVDDVVDGAAGECEDAV